MKKGVERRWHALSNVFGQFFDRLVPAARKFLLFLATPRGTLTGAMLLEILSISKAPAGRPLHAGLILLLLISTITNPSFNEFSEKQASAAQVIADEGSHPELQLFQQSKWRDERTDGDTKELARNVVSHAPVFSFRSQRFQAEYSSSTFTISLLYTQTTSSCL